jgi:hypothetical protein
MIADSRLGDRLPPYALKRNIRNKRTIETAIGDRVIGLQGLAFADFEIGHGGN